MQQHRLVRPRRFAALAAPLLCAAVVAACATQPAPPVAMAMLKPASGSQVNGLVQLTQEGDHVVVHAQVSGLAPNSEHGFHVHEKGDCTAPDASSAGGHFNPAGSPHGGPTGEHHLGDLPSLKADAAGEAETNFEVKGSLLGSGATDLMGRAMVVHADPDDYMSQPAGNSGARVACGVIATPAKPGGISGNGEAKTIPKQM